MAVTQPVIESPHGNFGESELNGAKIIRGPHGITVDDGSAGARIPQKGEFDENLGDLMEPAERKMLADRLIEYLAIDKQSRKDWEDKELRGMALMGLKDIPLSHAESTFVNSPGEAQVKMPLMMEAATHFQARAIAELYPATGPMKCNVIGERTKERVAQADRVETFGNYYLTTKDDGYFADTDQMLMYLPLAGSVFRKCAQNWVTGMPELRYVKCSNFIAPYAATNLKDATRYAHTYTMSGQDVRRAMESGMFTPMRLDKAMMLEATHSKTDDASDMREISEHDDDANYAIAEYHIDMELPIDSEGQHKSKSLDQGDTQDLLSYIVIVETTNQEVLMIRRNWKKQDKYRQRRIWFSHHKFFPGLGFYGWGYPHVMGTLQKAVNDGVNAVFDASLAATWQGGFITKEGQSVGLKGEISLEHGVWKPLQGSYEELQKALYTPPFHPPTPALGQLVEQLLQQGQRFASITESATGEADNRGPVGTTLALIEQSNIIPTSIHKRLHNSLGLELKMWADAAADFMEGNVYEYTKGEDTYQVFKEDFSGAVDVVPVSDPNIWSQKQRITLCQGTLELQARAPDLYQPAQRVEAHKRMLQAMRVPDIDAVGPQLSQPKYLDPIAENGLIMVGSAVRAFEPQDHEAHMTVHTHGKAMLMASQVFAQMLPDKQQAVLTSYDAHQAEHMALYYRRMIAGTSGIPLPPLDESGMSPELPPDVEAQITAAVVKKLPPPPPPIEQPGQDNGAQEAAALKAKTQADIEAKDMHAKAQVARDTEAFTSDQKRLELGHSEELRRKREQAALDDQLKQQALSADEARKDTQSATQIVRENAKAKVDIHTKREAANVALAQADKSGAVKQKHTEQQAAVKTEHTQKQAVVKTELAEQQAKIKADTLKREATQRIEAAKREHEVKTKIAEKQGTLKVQQAKEQGRAKKQAMKKTAKKKKA